MINDKPAGMRRPPPPANPPPVDPSGLRRGRGSQLGDCEGCGAPPELRTTCSYCGRLRFVDPPAAAARADVLAHAIAAGVLTPNEARRYELLDVTTLEDRSQVLLGVAGSLGISAADLDVSLRRSR